MSMDSNGRESSDTKAEFRKPSNDAGNRKYRRRSPIGGSPSSSDGSPHRGRSSSPVPSRKDISKFADDKRKWDDDRNQSGRNDESYKHSDRLTSRSHHRHDDHSRRDRHVNDYDRGYSKSSYRSSRDSRDNDYNRSDKEHRSRESVNDADTYSRAKSDSSGYRGRDKDSYDRAGSGRKHATIDERVRDRDRHREDKVDRYGRTDHRKSFGDHRSDLSPVHEEPRGQRNDFSARRESTGHHLKEASWRDTKELDSERHSDKRRNDDHGSYKEQGTGEAKEHSDDISIKGQDSVAKKPKILDSTTPGADGTSEQAYVKDSDIDAAKVAAMRAAELVNKNLVGTGYMSTDQKKKLLWGKKTTTIEESAHRWDTTTFGDRERQEKFNKLMSLRLHWWPIVGREGGGKGGKQARQPRCGKAARAASDGIGEAVHSWIASKRWSDCWTWSLEFFFRYPHASIDAFPGITMYCMKKLLCETRNVGHVVISFNLICKLARFLMLLRLTMLEIFRILVSMSGLSYFCPSYHMFCSHCFGCLVKFGIRILYCGMSLASKLNELSCEATDFPFRNDSLHTTTAVNVSHR